MAKRSSNPTLNKAARGVGRALGRIANGIDRAKAARRKLAALQAALKKKGNRPAPPPAKVGAKMRVKVVAAKSAKLPAKPSPKPSPKPAALKSVTPKRPAPKPVAKPKALTPAITMTPPEPQEDATLQHDREREGWKAHEQELNEAAKAAQRAALVDERAIARANSGRQWASRKQR